MSVNSVKWIFLVLVTLLLVGCSTGPKKNYDSFAKCLTEKGIFMYGAFWCPHCQKTKKHFGDSFQYVTYIECDPRGEESQTDRCIEMNIEGYDTWIFEDGSRLMGEPSFESMSEKSGCPLPE